MPIIPRNRRPNRRILTTRISAVAVAGALLIGACSSGADTSAAPTRSSSEPTALRPVLDIALRDGSMDIPDTFTGGITDVNITSEAGSVQHHLEFFRLDEGVTNADITKAGGNTDSLVTFEGGNGLMNAGDEAHITLDLASGRYYVVDLGEVNNAEAFVTVTEPKTTAPEPTTKGVIKLGPGMTITLPAEFDGTGVWRVDNLDSDEPHEAALLSLPAGTAVKDVIDWANKLDGPPPFDVAGGFGAIDAGRHGWVDLGKSLPAGDFAIACFLPGASGSLHVADGMIAGFSHS